MKNKETVYGLYKGDTFIDVGTAKELADRLGVTPNTIKFYSTPVARKRAKEDSNRIITIKLDDMED